MPDNILIGPLGQSIRLTEERMDHILLEHPEMAGLQWAIAGTLESPDVQFPSRTDPERVREFYREYANIGVGRFVKVVVCFENDDPFVLTAHGCRRVPRRVG